MLLPLLSLLLLPTPLLAQEAPTPRSCGRRNTPRYCAGTNYTASLVSTYLCGDSRLGPTRLPHRSDDTSLAPVLAAELFAWDRFGGLCPGEFVQKWFNESQGWWNYPPQDGFTVSDVGDAIKGNVTLPEETLLDRFGSERGNFVSPAGAPYEQRALPPSNLVGSDPAYPYNYHVYSVVKPLEVLAGPIAPWFGQPGAGVQYELYQSVATLIEQGYLQREDPSVLLP